MKKRVNFLLLIMTLLIINISVNSYSQDEGYGGYEDYETTDSSGDGTRPFQFSLYGTLGGYGLIYGVGGELLLFRNLGLNLGYSSWDLSDNNSNGTVEFTFIPMHAALYFGGNHRLYIEAGTTYVKVTFKDFNDDIFLLDEISGSTFLPTGGMGYNYCPENGNFYFKAGPMFYVIEGTFIPWWSVSMGVTF